jgi:hypothetical protein
MATIKVKFYTPIINKWDYQGRIYKNIPEIKWSKSVHEQLIGAKTQSLLPAEEYMSLKHEKTLDRQKLQNLLYSKIN